MRVLFAIALATLSLTAPAQAFTAINGLTVNPVPGGFEVTSQGRDGPRQIWCAAGQYARHSQDAGVNDRVFITQPYGLSRTRPGYRAVTFTTRPTADLASGPRLGDGGNYSVSIRRAGFSLTAGQAENFCSDALEDHSIWPF